MNNRLCVPGIRNRDVAMNWCPFIKAGHETAGYKRAIIIT